MTWRVPAVEQALAELEAYVRERWSPLGILVSGSIVRGEAGPTSDLDVFVVHAAPFRLRAQRRFNGIPTELFVNPPQQVRRYFEREHADARPSTAHMFATGETLGTADPVVGELAAEARAWLAKPVPPPDLVALRYAAVDLLDDARDVAGHDPAAATLLLASVVSRVVGYAFVSRGRFEPRRKRALAELDGIDPEAAALVRRFAAQPALATVEALAERVLGVTTFFEWESAPDPV